MGYLKICCRNCNGTFEVYREDVESKEKLRCPHCLATMDKRQWDKLVNAYFTIEEVNKGLRNCYEQEGRPLFQVEYRTHYVRPETYCSDY